MHRPISVQGGNMASYQGLTHLNASRGIKHCHRPVQHTQGSLHLQSKVNMSWNTHPHTQCCTMEGLWVDFVPGLPVYRIRVCVFARFIEWDWLCTWRIYEVDPVLFPVEGDCSRLYGDSPLPLLNHEVCHSVPVINIWETRKEREIELLAWDSVKQCRKKLTEDVELKLNYWPQPAHPPTHVYPNPLLHTSQSPGVSRVIQHSLCGGGLPCIYVCHDANVPDSGDKQ